MSLLDTPTAVAGAPRGRVHRMEGDVEGEKTRPKGVYPRKPREPKQLHRVIHGYQLKPLYYEVRRALMQMQQNAAYARLQRSLGGRNA